MRCMSPSTPPASYLAVLRALAFVEGFEGEERGGEGVQGAKRDLHLGGGGDFGNNDFVDVYLFPK